MFNISKPNRPLLSSKLCRSSYRVRRWFFGATEMSNFPTASNRVRVPLAGDLIPSQKYFELVVLDKNKCDKRSKKKMKRLFEKHSITNLTSTQANTKIDYKGFIPFPSFWLSPIEGSNYTSWCSESCQEILNTNKQRDPRPRIGYERLIWEHILLRTGMSTTGSWPKEIVNINWRVHWHLIWMFLSWRWTKKRL